MHLPIRTTLLAAAIVGTASVAQATTTFQTPTEDDMTTPAGSRAGDGFVSWDVFTSTGGPGFPSSMVSGPGATGGTNTIVSSDLLGNVTAPFTAPPGGLLGGGDRFYLHDGGALFTATATFNTAAQYYRVSYSLLPFGGDAPAPFSTAPTIAGGTLYNSGIYTEPGYSVFFFDFDLGAASASVSSTFGGPAPFSNFKSLDAVRVDALTTAVPEPGRATLLMAGLIPLILGRRRKRA